MSFIRDTWDWTKWYSKHAWNPWWLVKEHALSDNAFRDYQAETGGDIKWAKRARNVGRGVAALIGAIYAAPAFGAAGGAGAAGAEGAATGAGAGLTASSPEVLAGVYGAVGEPVAVGATGGSPAAGAGAGGFNWQTGARLLARALAQQQRPTGNPYLPVQQQQPQFQQTAGFGPGVWGG